MQTLKVLSKSCNFRDVTAKEYRDEAIRDAFISGLLDSSIRKRLLEHQTLDLQAAFDKAGALDLAQRNLRYYTGTSTVFNSNSAAVAPVKNEQSSSVSNEKSASAVVPKKNTKCFFCSYSYHARTNCPAKESVCYSCEKVVHFSRMCRSNNKKRIYALIWVHTPSPKLTSW